MEKKVESDNPQLEAFKKFMTQLTTEIDKALNPSGGSKVGFSLFVYPAVPSHEVTTMVSNTSDEMTVRAVRGYLNIQSKRTRRAVLKKVK